MRGQGTLSRTVTQQLPGRPVWTTDAQARQLAEESVFLSGSYGLPRLAAMIGANPQLVIAPYLKSIQNPVGDDSAGTFFPNPWYCHFKNGTKCKQGGTYVNWLMETGFYAETHQSATKTGKLSNSSVTAASWAEYHVRDSVAKINQVNAQAAQAGSHPFRGLWFDSNDTFSADATPGFFTSATNPGWNPHTNAAYTKPEFVNMAHWVGDMAQNLTAAGTVNPERLFTAANGLRSVSIGDHYDMAMAEGWMVAGGLGGSMTGGATAWEHRIDLALQVQSKGCVAELLDWGLSADSVALQRQKRRFAAASSLVANRGLLTFEYTQQRSTAAWLETAQDTGLYGDISTGGSNQPLDLGTPLTGQSPASAAGHAVAVGTGNSQASAAGLHARLYDGGTVLVNPTASSINYKASKAYTLVPEPGFSGASYVAGNLIPVTAGHAVILKTTSGGSGNTAPAFASNPDVTGTPQEGQTLTAVPGTLSAGSPAPTLTYQWEQSATGTGSWTNITGGTGSSYTIPTGGSMVGKFLRVTETATNSAGTASASSASTTVVTAASSAPVFTTQPSISGPPSEGSTLTVDRGVATGSPTYTYQWETSATGAAGSWTNIGGATATTYVLPGGSAGSYKRAKVTATNGSGATNAWAPKVGPVTTAGVAPSFSVAASVSGTTIAGHTLTLAPGTATGTPTPTLTQQWQRSPDNSSWTDITGQTGLTYLLTTADVNNYVRALVTATNSAGTATSSDSVGPVTTTTSFPDLTLQVSIE